MKEFFRGWRRKIGVATLTMACVFAVGWVRSTIVADTLRFNSTEGVPYYFVEYTSLGVMSVPNKIVLERDHISNSFDGVPSISWVTEPVNADGRVDYYDRILQANLKWRYEFLGFRYGEMIQAWTNNQIEVVEDDRAVVIPYFAAVVPLVLISSCLLLSKPRLNAKPDHA